MTEFDNAPEEQEPTAAPQEGAAAAESASAWSDVMKALDELGASVSAWAKAVKDDPETRRRASELQQKLDEFGRQLSDTFDAASRSEVAHHVTSAAVAAGEVVVETARKLGDEAAPRMAAAFRAVGDSIRKATEERTGGGTSQDAEKSEAAGDREPDA
jgi:hypothetical protein